MEREHPELCQWGDMPLETVAILARQIPKGVFIQLHWNGEPLLYYDFPAALAEFSGHMIGLDTNGKLLIKHKKAICKYLTSITISVIPDDPEGMDQLDIAGEFLEIGDRPLTIFRLLGEIDDDREYLIKALCEKRPKAEICYRVLHRPEGSFGYEKPVVKPEIGICLEMLHKLAIDRYGNVYPCVRYDPRRLNLLGNIKNQTLLNIWNGDKRQQWLQYHVDGRRDKVPLCASCEFWGIPRG